MGGGGPGSLSGATVAGSMFLWNGCFWSGCLHAEASRRACTSQPENLTVTHLAYTLRPRSSSRLYHEWTGQWPTGAKLGGRSLAQRLQPISLLQECRSSPHLPSSSLFHDLKEALTWIVLIFTTRNRTIDFSADEVTRWPLSVVSGADTPSPFRVLGLESILSPGACPPPASQDTSLIERFLGNEQERMNRWFPQDKTLGHCLA